MNGFAATGKRAAPRLLLAGLLGLIPVYWLMAMPGWPVNHEMLRLFRRIGIFAGQWSLGHWLPVWSTTAFHGFGSPSPIIYHKVFNVLSTGLYVLTGAPKTAVCLSVVIVLAIACLGAFRAVRVLAGGPDLALEAATGVLLAFSTYATTDWLTRGALAECCALAGVAWLFAWCLVLIREGRFSLWVGPLMAVICLSHAAIGLFCALPLGAAVLAAAPLWRHSWLAWCRNGAISILVAVLILLPVLVASFPYSGWSSLSALPMGMAGGNNRVDITRLWYEPVWHWGDAPFDLTLQIDPLLLVCGAAALFRVCTGPRLRPEGIFLLGTIAIAAALQSDRAAPVFRAVPVLYWLQFTFRLQTFVVVALALCGAYVLEAVKKPLGQRGIAMLLIPIAIAMSCGKPWLGAHPQSLYYSASDVAAAVDLETNASESLEYLPKTGSVPLHGVAAPCVGHAQDPMNRERSKARFSLACGANPAVLPVYLAPGMRLRVNGLPVTPYRTCNDAWLHVPAPADGTAELIYPTWLSAASASLHLAPIYACRP